MFEAVKFANAEKTELIGLGIPYGGPFKNRAGKASDLHGEYFTAKTDYAFDWFTERPLLYSHGRDKDAQLEVVGRVKSWDLGEKGVTTQAILDENGKYFEAIREAVDKGALFFSSGAMGHLVQTDKKTGEIKTWPWVELSLTPTPANFHATVDFITAQKHFKDAGLDLDAAFQKGQKQSFNKKIIDLKGIFETALAAQPVSLWQLFDVFCQTIWQIDQLEDAAEGTAISVDVNALVDEAVQEFSARLRDAALTQINDEDDDMMDLRSSDFDKLSTFIKAKADSPAGLPFALHLEAVLAASEEVVTRAKSILNLRIKEGRVLSSTNRDKLTKLHGQMGEIHGQMGELLDATDKKPASDQADDSGKSASQFRDLKARTLSLKTTIAAE